MAIRGRKPKPAHLKVVTGNPGRRPIERGEPELFVREEPLAPVKKLTKAQRALWDRFINKAWWLADHDVPKAFMWTCLQAEFDRAPSKMAASKVAQLRLVGSELGMDPASRARLGVGSAPKTDPAAKFFD